MSSAESHQAITAAVDSQKKWASRSTSERAEIIRHWAMAIRRNKEHLANLITAENGKILSSARTEVDSGVAALEWYAEESKRTYGYYVPTLLEVHREQLISHQPVGVVGVITPWNFPLAMITRKVGAALAAGCAVVLKPAEDTPLSALAIAHLATTEAKLPEGLLSILTAQRGKHGAEEIGSVMCSSPDVRLIGFTGSTNVGRMLYTKAATYGKRVLLELGGNAPFIVFRSADLDQAVSGAIVSKFRCSGQTCVSANRFLVEDSIYDKFVQMLVASVSQLTMGDGRLPNTQLGPLINAAAVQKVHRFVEEAKTSGAKVLTGGSVPTSDQHQNGHFYPATVLIECTRDMSCVRNEIFGPVAPVLRFRSESEAIDLANATNHGLAAYIYTQQIQQAWSVARQLQCGMVGINSPRVSAAEMPFGGVKDSGIGREGGPHALVEFMDVKTINWDLA
ncbi:unnamed protein product [Dicrocoelium dendriticum]|nr:unnamed protein product [Dicrocoelium dendriticum]